MTGSACTQTTPAPIAAQSASANRFCIAKFAGNIGYSKCSRSVPIILHMDNLLLAICIPSKNSEGATVIPRITTSLSYCPVCFEIHVQFVPEFAGCCGNVLTLLRSLVAPTEAVSSSPLMANSRINSRSFPTPPGAFAICPNSARNCCASIRHPHRQSDAQVRRPVHF